MASGKPAVDATGQLAYSVLQQGTGLVDAKAAVYGTQTNCANQGLNIAADLAGTQHYMGRVTPASRRHVPGHQPQRPALGRGLYLGPGLVWSQGYALAAGLCLAAGILWSQGMNYTGDIPWVNGYPSLIGTTVSSASTMSINSWVDPE